MKERLYEICENILEDETESKKFAKIKTVDELYEYLSEKVPNLSEEEFEDFIVETLGYAEESYQNSQKTAGSIDDDALDSVAGGVDLGTKIAAAGLALMTFFPAVGATNKKSNDLGSSAGTSISRDAEIDDIDWSEPTKWQKFKNWAKEHKKGLIAAGITTAALAVAAGVAYKAHKKKQEKKEQESVAGKVGEIKKRISKNKDTYMSPDVLKTIKEHQKDFSPDEKKVALFRAIDLDDIECINRLLEGGVGIDDKDAQSLTPLMYAVEMEHDGIVDLLLGKGANPNLANNNGFTAMDFARGKHSTVAVFKKHGINIMDARNIDDALWKDNLEEFKTFFEKQRASAQDYLVNACIHGSKKIIRYLVGKGVSLNKGDKSGTVLSMVIERGAAKDMVEFLLENGANPNNGSGSTALERAFTSKKHDVVDILIGKGARLNNDEKLHVLYALSEQNDRGGMYKLLKMGVDLKNRDPKSCGFYDALKANDISLIEILLKNGLDINKYGLLKEAAKSQNLEVMEILIKHRTFDGKYNAENFGHDLLIDAFKLGNEDILKLVIDVILKGGKCVGDALHEKQSFARWLYENGHGDKLIELLEQKIDVGLNEQPHGSRTVLMIAVEKSDEKMAKTLLKYGADIGLKWNGQTALNIADENKNYNIAKIIIDKLVEKNGKREKIILIEFADRGTDANIFEYLLKACENIREIQDKKSDFLIKAVQSGRPSVVKLLLNAGVDPEKCGALKAATEYNDNMKSTVREEIVTILLETGKIDKKSKNSKDAIYYAWLSSWNNCLDKLLDYGIDVDFGLVAATAAGRSQSFDALKHLVDRGIDVNKVSSNGKTPLMSAMECRYGKNKQKVIEYLLSKGADQNVRTQDGKTAITIAAQKYDASSLEQLLNDKNLKKETLEYSIKNLGRTSELILEKLREKFKTM